MLMENWYGKLIDFKGSFLIGKFDKNENIYLGFPEVFKTFTLKILYLFVVYRLLKCTGLKPWKQCVT